MDNPEGRYANHFQVGYNANEFLMDFGQDFGTDPPQIHTRIIMNPKYLEPLLALIRSSVDAWKGSEGPGK